MERNGESTLDVIRSIVPNLVYVPPLFDPPAQGYVDWATSVADLINLKVLDPRNPALWEKYVKITMGELDPATLVKFEKINPNTISGNLIQNTGPSWYYGLLLPVIIMGDFERVSIESLAGATDTLPVLSDWLGQIQSASSPEDLFVLDARVARLPISVITTKVSRIIAAKIARLKFENGQPLYVYVLGSEERFRSFVPVLTYFGEERYLIGHGNNTKKIKAATHNDAIYMARMWYMSERLDEIEEAKKAAHAVPNQIPPAVYDLLVAMLRRDKVLLDDQEVPLAWENGAHGMYGFQGPDWCYYTECAPTTAVQMALLAQMQAAKRGDESSLLIQGLAGNVREYLGFENVRTTRDGSIHWDSADISQWNPSAGKNGADDPTVSRGKVLGSNGEPLFLTEVKRFEGQKNSHYVRILGKGMKVWVESPIPTRWNLTDDDALFWGIHTGKVASRKKANQP